MKNLALILLFPLLLFGENSEFFSGNSAWRYLEMQLELGPRNPGSEGHRKIQELLIQYGKDFADTVVVQPFTGWNPYPGEAAALKNIIVRYHPEKSRRILLSAHYDTRPVADHDPELSRRNEPILGANDGGSGVAVLLTLMELLSKNPPAIGVDIAFWDGEDMGRPQHNHEFCQGSRYYASNIIAPKPQEGILLDMVGDAELTLYYEYFSMRYHPALMQNIWKLADELGFGDIFIPKVEAYVYDDHVPLNEIGGIPTINIIDFAYPNKDYNVWHTHDDTAEYCSSYSLETVGTVVLKWLRQQR
jgi:glutaminyl-peptide cyclotransferase